MIRGIEIARARTVPESLRSNEFDSARALLGASLCLLSRSRKHGESLVLGRTPIQYLILVNASVLGRTKNEAVDEYPKCRLIGL